MIPYVISSSRGGLSDEESRGIRGSFKFGSNLDIHKKEDTLSCQQVMVKQSGGTVVDLINFFVAASDGNTYGFGDEGNIYKRTSGGIYSVVYTDGTARSIKGAYEWEDDDGNNYLYWAYDTKIDRKPLPGAANWSDVDEEIQTLDSADWHMMKQAGGSLLMGNANKLAMVDYAGNFTDDAMNIRPGNVVKCLEEMDDFVIIGSTREDEAEFGHIWSWYSDALNWTQKKRIPSKGVNAIIDSEILLLQAGEDGELYFSDLQNKVPLIAFPGGGEVNPGGVCNMKGLAMFGAYGGDNPGIYSYGRKRKNRAFALNLDYIHSTTVTTIGAIEVIDGVLIASWFDGAEHGVDEVSSTVKADGRYDSLDFNAGAPFQDKLFQQVKITMKALASGCSLAVKYKMNKSTTWVVAKTTDNKKTFDTAEATKALFNINEKGEIFEIRVDLTSSGNNSPEILSITTYLDDFDIW